MIMSIHAHFHHAARHHLWFMNVEEVTSISFGMIRAEMAEPLLMLQRNAEPVREMICCCSYSSECYVCLCAM